MNENLDNFQISIASGYHQSSEATFRLQIHVSSCSNEKLDHIQFACLGSSYQGGNSTLTLKVNIDP